MRLTFLILVLVGAVVSTGCSSTDYNPTTYDYFISRDDLKQKPLKKVILATVNVSGEPTRSILRDSVDKVDNHVVDYLESNGYSFAPSHLFDNAWRQALLSFGNFYDPTTGKVDRVAWQQVMAATLQSLKEHKDIDAVIFTDLLEHDIQHSPGMKHYARWYGVSREPATEGPTSSVPTDFNWTQIIKGATLMVTIYTTDGKPLFSSRGGIDTLHSIDSRKSQKSFVRRKKILSRSSNIEEGIELAFHPLIKMKRYPGKARPAAEEANTTATAQ
ncbi:hypothetical protein DOK_08904 [gamma proteobacterium BDW918]|uniref:Lipoprotein n=1 Tax=Zhongshania aliphaticivorans TaxID=1470434 RepID=A0A127M6B9_9GAMM|nr:hypothetical protein [Zhongshania aliphaticivorans]AMO68783.1 hypothetical protein AZF00_10950 [Zhongshania aliphaticivorans]EIF43281.1 hypothetical protein DOK_08904 [gamma proteobacterium BDW918]